MVFLLKNRAQYEAKLDSIGECEVRVNGSPTHVANIVGKATIPSAYCIAASMWERPQTELLLRNLPQPREAVGLDDQEKDDQAAEHDQLEVRH